MVVENEEDCGPRVTASVIASHFGGSTAHFKLRLNLPCYLLASIFFPPTLCCPKNRFRSLRTGKALLSFIQLWGKSPEKQSMSSTIPRKAAGFKHVGTG